MHSNLSRAATRQTVRKYATIAARKFDHHVAVRRSSIFEFADVKIIHKTTTQSYLNILAMGKKKSKGEYNDFLDGEKLRDNAEIRTSLQGSVSVTRDSSPPPPSQHDRRSQRKGPRGKGSQKPGLTHFLCLPLVTEGSKPQLQTGLEKLRRALETENTVPAKAMRSLGTLHLTLGVMSVDEEKVGELKQYLQDLDLYALLRDISLQRAAEDAAEKGAIGENFNAASMPDPEALAINLESLLSMHTPNNTSMLYAEPRDASQRLYAFGSELRKRFTSAEYMVEDTRPLKLHATMINTIYAKAGGKRGTMKCENTRSKSERNGKGIPQSHGGPARIDEDDNSESTTVSMNDHASANIVEGQDTEERAEGHGPNVKSWMRFDARALMIRFENFMWAEGIPIDKVHICKMGAKKIWSGGSEGEGEVIDEQYEVIASKSILG